MDPKIKEQLLKMKEQGFSYRRISFLLNIPLSNVKSIVLRARKAPVKKIYCKTCGKYVKQPKGKKEKNFCSDKCRTKWWNAHKDLIKHLNLFIRNVQSVEKLSLLTRAKIKFIAVENAIGEPNG